MLLKLINHSINPVLVIWEMWIHPFITINTRFTLTWSGSICNFLSMCQIDLFKKLLIFNYTVHKKYPLRNNYTTNLNINIQWTWFPDLSWGSLWGVMADTLSCSLKISSNLSCYYHIYPTPLLGQDMTQGQFFKRSLTCRAIMFTFGLISLGKVWTLLSSQLWIK